MHPEDYATFKAGEKLCYSIPAAVAATNISRSRLYEMIRNRELRVFKCGRRTLISADELRGLIARLQAAE